MSSGRSQDEDYLLNAVRVGNLEKTKDILKSQRPTVELNESITSKGETALHIAVINGHEHIVKELVENQMSNEGLKMCDSLGYTALITAAVLGNKTMVDCMLHKLPSLISIKSSNENLPVVIAIKFGQIAMARHLFYPTPIEDLIPQAPDNDHQEIQGAELLNGAIYTETLDIALGLILLYPRLALALDKDEGLSPILALASMPQSFPSGNQLGFWKQLIYSCMRIPSAPDHIWAGYYFSNRSVPSAPCCYLVSRVLNFLGITQLYEMKKIHGQYNELLYQMCKGISESRTHEQRLKRGLVYDAICQAAKNGIFEFVSKMLETDRQLTLFAEDKNERNIFMLAVLHRQEKIFNILYGLDTTMNYFLTCLDFNDNNMLHMAGIITNSATRVSQIPGAALQMQRELQWFKEVERIVQPKFKENTNKDDLTPQQLFTKNHKEMMEKGEKWMKDTAGSCTVVGALIVTVMFAAAFTIPGGNKQDTGLPIFLEEELFRVFMISDALSFFLSSTSVLMFLGILTSRYSEDDFLEYLPRQMIIGLFTLFCSIATMMVTFSSALLIVLNEQLRIAIPLIICLACVPVTLFLRIQFRILKDMILSTYGPSIFNRKMKLKSFPTMDQASSTGI